MFKYPDVISVAIHVQSNSMAFAMHLTEPLLLWYTYDQCMTMAVLNCINCIKNQGCPCETAKYTAFGVARSCYFESTYGNHHGFTTSTCATPLLDRLHCYITLDN